MWELSCLIGEEEAPITDSCLPLVTCNGCCLPFTCSFPPASSLDFPVNTYTHDVTTFTQLMLHLPTSSPPLDAPLMAMRLAVVYFSWIRYSAAHWKSSKHVCLLPNVPPTNRSHSRGHVTWSWETIQLTSVCICWSVYLCARWGRTLRPLWCWPLPGSLRGVLQTASTQH